ncbi:Rrf2 family transcriptional regulator (plasmid) [Pseudorhodobacter turbinis]|uniref:Rrf2 family transcriptional regulator n=1 Tax=Pseudorhodobacter turbinis TaxID=2500533 RepID=A0A4P8EIP3_9RHOB|nr:Rrf2 family transcriptional regulator [Pseudorhodobacter turbinis]QCO56837.1 Rrf2 family transcriptional regulator [Pseudorhodobacter turbinis]
MRLTVRTNLAMRTLMYCAVNEGHVVRKQEVAKSCDASENHLAQVIHKLAQAGFITTVRGRSGGLKLNRTPDSIRVGEVVRSFEASVPFTECMDNNPDAAPNCPLVDVCRLKSAFSTALEAFYASLDSLTLADMVNGNSGLRRLLAVA